MTPDLAAMRTKLIQRHESLPDYPPADQVEDLVRRSIGLVALIGWIDCNPEESMTNYRAYLAKVQADR